MTDLPIGVMGGGRPSVDGVVGSGDPATTWIGSPDHNMPPGHDMRPGHNMYQPAIDG
ncbi:MAG: hypothetical protein RIK87_02800 [Fuerstiella sp.]